MSMANALALHPMPLILKLFRSSLIEYLLTMMEERDGEGQKPLQLTMSMSMSLGETLVLDKRSSKIGKRTIWASWIAASWVDLGGM